MGAYESSHIHRGMVYRVESRPVHWMDIQRCEADHLSWLADPQGVHGLTGGFTMAFSTDRGKNDGMRTLVYMFEDENTAFAFKMRWG